MKFCQNFQFLTFVIFVAEIPNKHFCKLDKILKKTFVADNFLNLSVLEKFGFENRNFKRWSCDILERYCAIISLLKILNGSKRANQGITTKYIDYTLRTR